MAMAVFGCTARTAAKVIKECAQHDLGDFYRQCIEVVESISGDQAPYRIIYSVMWGKEMDMVVVNTFGAPQATWREADHCGRNGPISIDWSKLRKVAVICESLTTTK
jgi:hypothetical protein